MHIFRFDVLLLCGKITPIAPGGKSGATLDTNFTHMDGTIISLLVGGLAYILPKLGITIGSDALTTTVSTIIVLVSGIVAYIHTVKSKGLTAYGARK